MSDVQGMFESLSAAAGRVSQNAFTVPNAEGEGASEDGTVSAKVEEADESTWVSFTTLAYNWMVEGMKNLAGEGFFEATYPGANVSFWVTDSNEPVENVIEWVELLNPPERSAAYVTYLRDHGL